MAQQPPAIAFDDGPLEEARKISRGPRVDPELSHALKENIHVLGSTATCMTTPEGLRLTAMKHRILLTVAEVSSSGARLTKISRKPRQLMHGSTPLGRCHRRPVAAAAGADHAAHQRDTILQWEVT